MVSLTLLLAFFNLLINVNQSSASSTPNHQQVDWSEWESLLSVPIEESVLNDIKESMRDKTAKHLTIKKSTRTPLKKKLHAEKVKIRYHKMKSEQPERIRQRNKEKALLKNQRKQVAIENMTPEELKEMKEKDKLKNQQKYQKYKQKYGYTNTSIIKVKNLKRLKLEGKATKEQIIELDLIRKKQREKDQKWRDDPPSNSATIQRVESWSEWQSLLNVPLDETLLEEIKKENESSSVKTEKSSSSPSFPKFNSPAERQRFYYKKLKLEKPEKLQEINRIKNQKKLEKRKKLITSSSSTFPHLDQIKQIKLKQINKNRKKYQNYKQKYGRSSSTLVKFKNLKNLFQNGKASKEEIQQIEEIRQKFRIRKQRYRAKKMLEKSNQIG